MFLVDLTHTTHTHARTGIQQVSRQLLRALSVSAETASAVVYDARAGDWRWLDHRERKNLQSSNELPTGGGDLGWTRWQKMRGGIWKRFGGLPSPHFHYHPGMFLPEVFSPAVGAALPSLVGRLGGPRVAIFHDAIPVFHPELCPPYMRQRFPDYLREIHQLEGIACVSAAARDDLFNAWTQLGLTTTTPRVEVVPVCANVTSRPTALPTIDPREGLRLLYVSALHPRKNHLGLLEACEKLWAEGFAFRLDLVGADMPDGSAPLHARLAELQAKRRPVRWRGQISDLSLEAAYRNSHATVFPSTIEGFGMPVLESVSHGRPCVCTGRGGLAEASQGGGCLLAASPAVPDLVAVLRRLLTERTLLEKLAEEARARRFRTWADYAQELSAFAADLPYVATERPNWQG